MIVMVGNPCEKLMIVMVGSVDDCDNRQCRVGSAFPWTASEGGAQMVGSVGTVGTDGKIANTSILETQNSQVGICWISCGLNRERNQMRWRFATLMLGSDGIGFRELNAYAHKKASFHLSWGLF